MKHAALWKRILYEGVRLGKDGDMAGAQRLIAMQPIIVGQPEVEAHGMFQYGGYDHLGIPFPLFWMESRVIACSPQWSIGHYCEVSTHDDGSRHLTAHHFVDANRPPWYLGITECDIDREGALQFKILDNGHRALEFRPSTLVKHVDPENMQRAFRTILSTLFDNLQLLGCANVSLSDRPMPERCERDAVKRQGPKDGGYRYHVLVVRKAGAKTDSPGIEIGAEMPLHVCRGHFAEYGPKFGKGLLFGRLEGRFYIPPHMKGKAEHGVVEKDYEIAGVKT